MALTGTTLPVSASRHACVARRKIVQHNMNLDGVRILDSKFAHLIRKITRTTLICDFNHTLASQRFKRNEQIRCAFSPVLVILAFDQPWFGRQCVLHVGKQLVWFFIKANHWMQNIMRQRVLHDVRSGIKAQDVLHAPNEICCYLRDAPTAFLPGFDNIFFSLRRTVSSLRLSTTSSSTIRSASNCITSHVCYTMSKIHDCWAHHCKPMRSARLLGSHQVLVLHLGERVRAKPPRVLRVSSVCGCYQRLMLRC